MSKPLVDLPDAEREVIDALLAAGHAQVKTDYPSIPLGSSEEWLQVDLESSNVDAYPVAERAQVRVTVHVAGGRRTSAKRIAAEVLADLYTYASANVAGVVPLGGRSAVSTDPATKNVMCWVLVRVNLLASLAS